MIKLLLTDLDGTLTDGTYAVDADGRMTKTFNTRDMHGLFLLNKQGVHVGVVTGANSGIEKAQIAKSLPFADGFYGVKDKLKIVKQSYIDSGLFNWQDIAYIGDDTNDLALLNAVGLPMCPCDAEKSVRNDVTKRGYIAECAGGKRCVRDCVEFIARINGVNLDEHVLSTGHDKLEIVWSKK